MVEDVARYCASVDLVPLPKWRAYMNCLLALPTLTPLRVAYYRSPAFIDTIKQVIRRQAIEVVHGELIKVVPALQALQAQETLPLLYDSVDCISSYLQQQWSSQRHPLKKAFVYTELKKMRRYEHRALGVVDQVVVTTAVDQKHLLNLGKVWPQIQVVPNGVDTDYFTPPAAPREKDSLVFCAKLDYYPNSQAIVHFCREVLPVIWEQRPQVRLTIVGSNPPPAVRSLSADSRITVTGYVPDIRPYLGKASVALAPLQVAAGMQNKVLEALAMGASMVVTPNACRALDVKHGVHLLIAEGGKNYAQAVLSLLEDTTLAQALAHAGRAYVEQQYSWKSAAAILEELYASLRATHKEETVSSAEQYPAVRSGTL